MTTVVRTERRKRGVFGWIVLLAFWAFNLFMAWALLSGLTDTAGRTAALTSDAERAGAAIGTALGVGFILFVWMAGAVILGLFTWLTAGRKVITETRGD